MGNATDEDLQYLNATAGITLTGSVLSTLSCVILLVSLFSKPVRKYYTAKLFIFLTFSNLAYELMVFIGSIRYLANDWWASDDLCKFQSFILTWSCLSSYWWTFFLVLHVFLLHTKRKSFLEDKMKAIFACHFLAWVITIVITAIAVSRNSLGEYKSMFSHTWCWINGSLPPKEQILWILMAGKFWEILTYIGISVIFILYGIHKKRCLLRYNFLKSTDEEMETFNRPSPGLDISTPSTVFFVIFNFYVFRLWGTIRYIYQMWSLDKKQHLQAFEEFDQKGLFFMHCFMDSVQPIANLVLVLYLKWNLNKKPKKLEDRNGENL